MTYDRGVAREAQNLPWEEPILVVADSLVVEYDSENTLLQAYCGVSEDILQRERMNYTAYLVEDLALETWVKQGQDAVLSLHIM